MGRDLKAPSLFYLYDPAFGNEKLKPEKSSGWDAGVEEYLLGSKINFGITYFSNTFDNLFGFDANYKTININKAESKGLEIFLQVKPIEELTVKSNYTYTKTKDLSDDPIKKDKPLLRRPIHKGVLNINYNFLKDFNANVDFIYVGKRDDIIFSPNIKRIQLDSYTLINLAVSYDVLKFLEVYGKINNAADTYYEEVYGYATPGLSVYGGFKLKL